MAEEIDTDLAELGYDMYVNWDWSPLSNVPPPTPWSELTDHERTGWTNVAMSIRTALEFTQQSRGATLADASGSNPD